MKELAVYVVSFIVFAFVSKRRCSSIEFTGVGPAALFTVGLAIVAAARFSGEARFAFAVLAAGLVVCAYTDVRTGYVFDGVTLGASLTLIIVSAAWGTLWQSLAGAAAGVAPFVAILVATRGRGIGVGDLKIAAMIGLCLGAASTLVSIGFAFVLGALWAGGALLRRSHGPQSQLPLAPFLSLGVAIVSTYSGASSWLNG